VAKGLRGPFVIIKSSKVYPKNAIKEERKKEK